MSVYNHLCVMLRLSHVDCHVCQALEALSAPHALQDLPRLCVMDVVISMLPFF